AILAPQGASLYYCKLSNNGEGSITAEGSNITLDTCIGSSVLGNNNHIYTRTLLDESLSMSHVLVRQYDKDILHGIWNFVYPTLVLSGGDGYTKEYRSLPVEWNSEQFYAINTDFTGTTKIEGQLDPIFQGLGLDNIPLTLTVEVKDATLPCISKVSYKAINEENYFYLSLWNTYTPEDGNVILWQSDDDGKTWWDATWSDDIAWDENTIIFQSTLNKSTQFIIEEIGVGQSNSVVVFYHEGLGYSGKGGDRTGTDRDGEKPEEIVPVTDDINESTSTVEIIPDNDSDFISSSNSDSQSNVNEQSNNPNAPIEDNSNGIKDDNDSTLHMSQDSSVDMQSRSSNSLVKTHNSSIINYLLIIAFILFITLILIHLYLKRKKKYGR
ncbi:MAG: hypothetical protein ACK5LC_07980, partial [Coprobacillaceae bacterium]